jgi:hypothetical protein
MNMLVFPLLIAALNIASADVFTTSQGYREQSASANQPARTFNGLRTGCSTPARRGLLRLRGGNRAATTSH